MVTMRNDDGWLGHPMLVIADRKQQMNAVPSVDADEKSDGREAALQLGSGKDWGGKRE